MFCNNQGEIIGFPACLPTDNNENKVVLKDMERQGVSLNKSLRSDITIFKYTI